MAIAAKSMSAGERWDGGKGSEIENDELGLLWPAIFSYVATTFGD